MSASSNGYSLVLDVGNSNMFAGVIAGDGTIALRFRKTSIQSASADEYGVFLKSALRENGMDPAGVGRIALCSVVPDTIYSIRRACQKYFGLDPFILRAGVKTGLHIAYRNPLEVGADRIANAVAVTRRHPNRDCIVVDMGTATTFDAVSATRKYLGGAIMPGMHISMEALEHKTAKLPSVEITRPEVACGRSTVESIQSGLYFAHAGAIRELVARIGEECFGDPKPLTVATGGFSQLFADDDLFDEILPDLVLEGLWQAMLMNGDDAGATPAPRTDDASRPSWRNV